MSIHAGLLSVKKAVEKVKGQGASVIASGAFRRKGIKRTPRVVLGSVEGEKKRKEPRVDSFPRVVVVIVVVIVIESFAQ